ncbi:MAG: 30S ribosomal protein S16 [Patescibacteria group bacterium]
MLVIKLVRFGKKNLPSFRVAVTEGSKVVELLGFCYPHPGAFKFVVSKERLEHWLKLGAQPTAAVEKLVKGKYEFKKYVPKKPESREAAAPAAAAPAVAPAAEAPAEAPTPEEPPAESGKPAEAPTTEGVGVPTEASGEETNA